MKLVNHPVHGINCMNSFCLCVKTTFHVYKMLHVKGPLKAEHVKLRNLVRGIIFCDALMMDSGTFEP